MCDCKPEEKERIGKSSHYICRHNRLSDLRPDLAAEFDVEKNVGVDLKYLTVRSGKKVWWRCLKVGTCECHVWKATADTRSNGSGCPYCACKKVCKHNNLAVINPHLVKEWHSKNKLPPESYSFSSNVKVWWKCRKDPCGCHEWEAKINARSNGNGCPFCAGKKNLLSQ